MNDDRKIIGAGELVDTKSLVELGATVANVNKDNDFLYSVVPAGYQLAVHDLAERNEELEIRRKEISTGRPARHTGTQNVADVNSFIAMVEREQIPSTTIIKAFLDDQAFCAVINYAEDGKIAGHSDRNIRLELKHTPEFTRWSDMDRVRVSQKALAEFLEENMDDILEPTASEVIEMISNLKVKSKAQYHSVVDVNTGNQSVVFSESIKGETVNGSLEFFSKFSIGVAPFRGSKRHEMQCRLRFSVVNERMEVFFSIINRTQAMEKAFETESNLIKDVADKLSLPLINV